MSEHFSFKAHPNAEVRRTVEFDRIFRLPRRKWTEESAKNMADILTPLLKKPEGTMSLLPIQAQALHDAGTSKGLLAPICVGGGKTLTTGLLPWVMGAHRVVLLVPAGLAEKTKREFQQLSLHWRINHAAIYVMSYELLGRSQSSDFLTNFRPDLIIADEGHRLKNTRAAVTKRVGRYVDMAREMWKMPVRVCILSGSITKRSLKDYAHLLEWTLDKGSPLPNNYTEVEEWSNALDEKSNIASRIGPGPLGEFVGPEDADEDAMATIRKGWSRRLRETPGVVSTGEGSLDTSLYIDATHIHCPDPKLSSMEGVIARVRDTWQTPDEWEIEDGVTMWSHMRQIALGFYYRWNPRPPMEWMLRRQMWGKFVRETIKYSANSAHPMDSAKQVALAVTSGRLDKEIYQAWKTIEPTFTPETEAVWLDDGVIDWCTKWMHAHPSGIVWSEHTSFGARLAEKSGFPYFGREGKDAQGRIIDKDDIKGPIVASRASNSTGRNLQHWHQNLFPCMPGNAEIVEQTVGRTHRRGQTADEVSVDILLSCIEHMDSLEKCMLEAKYIQDSTGQRQKLLYADLTMPSTLSILTLASRRFHR